MKLSFAIALLFAVVSVEAINLHAEPSNEPAKEASGSLKKEDAKKDEAAIQAKFDAQKAKKEAMDEKAKDAEGKAMAAEDADAERKKKAYQTAYWGHIADQKAETQRIKDLREKPKDAKSPNESYDATSGSSSAEHWTASMPDHILENKEGPTAAWDSPAPPKKAASTEPAKDGK